MSSDGSEIDYELVEELRASNQNTRKFGPVVLDAEGKTVDGTHRLLADKDWPSVVNSEIKSEKDRVLCAIALNWHRREKSSDWKASMIEHLCHLGMGVKEIVAATGLCERTVYSFTPKEFKNEEPPQLAGARVSLQQPEYIKEEEDDDWEARESKSKSKTKLKEKSIPEPELKILQSDKRAHFRENMHCPVSSMDEGLHGLLQRYLTPFGVQVEFQKEIVLVRTIADSFLTLPNGKHIAIFNDGPPHLKPQVEERDEFVRDLLQKKGVDVLPNVYKTDSPALQWNCLVKIVEQLNQNYPGLDLKVSRNGK